MSISVPHFSLSDLTAKDLAEEMVRRIPAHAPEWKNAQTGDPGRALIDLVAWMGETILYRVNLVPRRQRLEFLRLLGLRLRPAAPASGLVAFSHKQGAAAQPAFLDAGTRLTGPVPFETTSPVTVQPFDARFYYKRRLSRTETAGLRNVIDDLAELYGVQAADPYAATEAFAGGRAAPEGLDPFSESIDSTLWIALMALNATPSARDAAMAALDAQPALLNIGLLPRLITPDRAAEAGDSSGHFEWAVSAKNNSGLIDQDIFTALAVADDPTRSMTREGAVRLVMPASGNVACPENDITADIEAGLGERPPRIDDETAAKRIIAWIRLRPKSGAGALPLSWMGINAVTADARESRRNLMIGTGDGRPGQALALPAGNAGADGFSLSVEQGGIGFVPWEMTEDLAAHGREDRVFELNAQEGVVTFGDGLAGKMPEPGARIRLDHMRSGGGEDGNLAAGAISAVQYPGLDCLQPAAMSGGRAGESLEQAEMRVTAWLKHNDRCVTESDYKAIAGELGLARVEVLPRFRPQQQRSDSAGAVSVMALPYKPVIQAPNPRPDRRLLDQVRAYLEPRRPLGTELFVIHPDYAGLGAGVSVNVRDGYAPEAVESAVRAAILAFLWPLSGGGRDGAGWPLGLAVSNLEIELVTARVPGVLSTAGAALFAAGESGFTPVARDPASGAQLLHLASWQLPELLQVDVVFGAPAPPASMADLSGRAGGRAGTAVPVVPDLC